MNYKIAYREILLIVLVVLLGYLFALHGRIATESNRIIIYSR